jgi:hypothetical protein
VPHKFTDKELDIMSSELPRERQEWKRIIAHKRNTF